MNLSLIFNMIKGKKKDILSAKHIFSRVSEYEVYKFYLGHDFKIGKLFSSPFRRDSNPSFSVGISKSGKLKHLDFGDSSKRGDCIDFVMQLLFLDYNSALKRINSDMRILGQPSQKVHKPIKEKSSTLIQVVTRKFDTYDLKYWSDYYITAKELKENDVYAVKKLYVNRIRIMLPVSELTFGYLMDNRWKIYRPFADKREKWLTNVPNNYISGMGRITPGCEKAVVTKAKKDEILLSKLIPHVASVQSENEFSISKESIDILTNRCGEVYLNFDSDTIGIEACKYYNQFGFKWINCPRGYFKPDGSMIKDFSDLAKYQGLEKVVEHFKRKNLLT